MNIQQIAKEVADVSIYSEKAVRDFFEEKNHLGQETVGVMVARVLQAELDNALRRTATQSRLTASCGQKYSNLEIAYKALREAAGFGDYGRYLSRATNLARTLALRDGVVLSRSDLWLSLLPDDEKYWSMAVIAMEQITGIPAAKVLAEAAAAHN